MPSTKKYWYKLTIFNCPVCGSQKRYRERVYVKPKEWEWHDYYDYCQEWGG